VDHLPSIDGFPVISYIDFTNEDLKVAHCTNIDCTAVDTPTTIDTVLSAGSDTSITIGTDGLPVISYLDGVSSNLKVAHCGDIDCAENTNVNTLTIVDNTAAVGFESSITIGTDGLPVISYQDSTNGDLKVAHCGDIDCAENTNVNTLTIVDNAVNVGSESSITIGTDGFPVISYRDGQSNDLKVAHCTNTSCSTSTITTVDFAVDLNDATSIAIGTDGLPVISYFDDDGLDLKVTKCTNPNCLNNWIRR